MALSGDLNTHIRKLSHPMKEIRDRALELLRTKLRLGWQLKDELAETRELLRALLSWFQVQTPSLQHEALELLVNTIKSKDGTYIVREMGVKQILSNLDKVKHKIQPDAVELFEDVVEALQFLNTVESEENVTVPNLLLNSLTSSETNFSSGCGNFGSNNETPSYNNDVENGDNLSIITGDGVRVLLFPWVQLNPSDLKTIILVEDSLKILKSTRRCCRFIRDVFLRDFPAEIFLNRPYIIKSLLSIADGQLGVNSGEALHVLLCITQVLHERLLQLFSLDLINDLNQNIEDCQHSNGNIDQELEKIVGRQEPLTQPDAPLLVLRQLPAPLYALDAAHTILSIMAKSMMSVDSNTSELLSMKELNICTCLIESLVKLLLECVHENFWSAEHNLKTHRDISHKSCMIMRMLGELLITYRKSYTDNIERTHHRVVWLRLVSCAEVLLNWAKKSPLPPASLIVALQSAQLDPAVDLLYPKLSKRISTALLTAKAPIDPEYVTKYKELTKLYTSMEAAVEFMKRKGSGRLNKSILAWIMDSLPVLQFHHSETFLSEIADVVLIKSKDLDFNENDWTMARSVALNIMAYNADWVCIKFYKMMADMVKSVLISDDDYQTDNEKCLTLLCDVGVLTEICCHGLSSHHKEIESSATEILLYLLRGRLVMSDGCWWRLFASLLPVLPLLHVYAAHDTHLGKAICKSLEPDIIECMGVSSIERTTGLVRLLFVNCAAVQLDAALSLCRLLDDSRYLPPRESLRTDILMNALTRVELQEFNIDNDHSPSKTVQTTGLIQILDVLKQDLSFDEDTSEYVACNRGIMQPMLEPSLRRSTLQQLAVMLRHQELHEAFLQYDGLRLIVTIFRMSLLVDDYLAFPECAISCVSILNSLCFVSRHNLAKIPDLPLMLLRVILIFPANEGCVAMAAQVLSLVAWSGFALQELDSNRHKLPALPLCVTQRTKLPFAANSYWNSSPNAEHSFVEWLMSDETWRSVIRVRWWWVCSGGVKALRGPHSDRGSLPTHLAPRDLPTLKSACLVTSCTKALLALENSTSHSQVIDVLYLLECYMYLSPQWWASGGDGELGALPWQHTKRFLTAPPASSRDTMLLVTLLQFIIAYMDSVPHHNGAMSWVKAMFIGKEASVIALLSRDRFYPQQTPQEDIDITQLRIHIIKVLLRCIKLLEYQDDYDANKMESLIKILIVCLERTDLKNFHMLGYLNELIRCIRYAQYSKYCKLSEETMTQCLRIMTKTLVDCSSGGGRKGQACRLDAMLSLLSTLTQINETTVPVQRWSETWSGEAMNAVTKCTIATRVELRAVGLHVMAALAQYPQLLPQMLQSLPKESMSAHALDIFSRDGEANVVRAAAASLLVSVTARTSSHTQVMNSNIIHEMKEYYFLEQCLNIFVDFSNEKGYRHFIEPNVSLSMVESRSALEVCAKKHGDVQIMSTYSCPAVPPTPALVATVANIIHNITHYKAFSVQDCNEQGIYRVLFKCASWCGGSPLERSLVRVSACRALCAAVTHRAVLSCLAATKDCLYNFLSTLEPLEKGEDDVNCVLALRHGLLLLAALLQDRSASDSVWCELKEKHSTSFFLLLLQSMGSEEIELREAAVYCLSQIAQSTMHKKHADKTKDTSCIEFLDNLTSPVYEQSENVKCNMSNDCQPEHVSEELCRVLMNLHRQLSEHKKYLTGQDDSWTLVCSCLSSVFAVSGRGRLYGVHRQFPRVLLSTLQIIRDKLSLQGKPVDVIRNADNDPILHALYWIITLMNCSMLDCPLAKESYADDNIAISLNRLWPWCMMTEQLRKAVLNLLLTFTNDCPKAWASMSVCVGGRSLMVEVCALVRHSASRTRAPLLTAALRLAARCVPHHHCRAALLKSEALNCISKIGTRSNDAWTRASLSAWLRVAEAVARHADGAAALLVLTASPALAPPPSRLLPALAHAAHHHRLAFLRSPDLLDLLASTLLTGDTAAVVSAARAVWALAANNHRAKLVLRSAGVTTAVQSAIETLQRVRDDQASQRALQLLTYTHTVLQAT